MPDTAVAYLAALDMTKALIGDGQIDEIKNVFSMLKSGACVNEIFLQSVDASHMEGNISLWRITLMGVFKMNKEVLVVDDEKPIVDILKYNLKKGRLQRFCSI